MSYFSHSKSSELMVLGKSNWEGGDVPLDTGGNMALFNRLF